jgi:hypothetical protein
VLKQCVYQRIFNAALNCAFSFLGLPRVGGKLLKGLMQARTHFPENLQGGPLASRLKTQKKGTQHLRAEVPLYSDTITRIRIPLLHIQKHRLSTAVLLLFALWATCG